MGDSVDMSGSAKNLKMPTALANRKTSKHNLVISIKKNLQNALKPLVHVKDGRLIGGSTDQVLYFVLKVVALDLVRRLSNARCPSVWKCLQALQIFCYPPLKWIQIWTPFKFLIKEMQKLSKPLLFLTIATTISDKPNICEEIPGNIDEPHQSQPEAATSQLCSELRTSVEAIENDVSKNWSLCLKEELEMQGITLPERINEDELQRFYTATNGDFSRLLTSIKKTIRWRETYSILSPQELDMWSHLVFWHGCDVNLRPCLVVRLGLACSGLAYQERPRFAQAVVSQIEHGVLHLVNPEDARITVLMDCEGVSAFKFPMQMMRSCSTLVQDHFPNRLALMFIVRLPPVVRVIAHTLIQVLRPSTRQKMHFVGEACDKVLLEYLQTIPSFLGSHCLCARCNTVSVHSNQHQMANMDRGEPDMSLANEQGEPYLIDSPFPGDCEQILRTAVVGILMLWIFIALVISMYEPSSRFLLVS